MLHAFQFNSLQYDAQVAEYYHPGRSARAVMDGVMVAQFGQIHPETAASRKLRRMYSSQRFILPHSTSMTCGTCAITPCLVFPRLTGISLLYFLTRWCLPRLGRQLSRSSWNKCAVLFRWKFSVEGMLPPPSIRFCCGLISSPMSEPCVKTKWRSGLDRSLKPLKRWVELKEPRVNNQISSYQCSVLSWVAWRKNF